eukprot:TRINITY_DN2255_c0_g1_i2.p1 TRINITY_DN2255_c0_g1~~TRINITY_DN2255_c0_g1_i2.p1  ORF type:complete len:152 (-),score=27.86 TRINITY_DN2255_c0_g1_i2:857-1312(-)
MSAAKVTSAFVYGSLLAEEVLVKLLGRVPSFSPATVKDYHRYSQKNVTYPAVLPCPGDQVNGKVLFGLTDREMAIFDEFEADEYVRTLVSVALPVAPPQEPSGEEASSSSSMVPAYMYVWGNPDDPNLYGSWDYEAWRRDCMVEFIRKNFP